MRLFRRLNVSTEVMESNGASPVASVPSMNGKVALLTLLVITLGITNILTLVDEQFHRSAFSLIVPAFKMFGSEKFLANSPSEARKRDAAIATAALQKENAVLSRRVLELTSDALAIHAELKNLKVEKNAAIASAREWEERHRLAEGRITKNRTSIQRLTKSLSQRFSRNSVRAISTLTGKAIPYLGIAVTLTFTGMDLSDACDSIREMNQMSQSMELPTEDESTVCGIKLPTTDAIVQEVSRTWRTSYSTASELVNQAGHSMPAPPTTDELVKQATSLIVGMQSFAPVWQRN